MTRVVSVHTGYDCMSHQALECKSISAGSLINSFMKLWWYLWQRNGKYASCSVWKSTKGFRVESHPTSFHRSMKSPYSLLPGYLDKGIVPINKTSRILVSSRDMITKLCYFPVLPSSPQVGVTLLCCIIFSMECHEGFIVWMTLKWVFCVRLSSTSAT